MQPPKQVSRFQPGNIHPLPLFPAPNPQLSQLHTFRTLQKRILPRLVHHYMPQKQFPLNLKRVIENLIIRNSSSSVQVINIIIYVRIPSRTRRDAFMLYETVFQTRHGAPFDAIDLNSEQIITAYVDSSERIEIDNNAVDRLESRIRRIIRDTRV